jgi:predicted FMN-binding regulatory protein PaiB
LWGWVQANLNNSGVTNHLRDELRVKYEKTATKLSNNMSEKDRRNLYKELYGSEANASKKLQIFGEVGIKLSTLDGLIVASK